MIVREFEPAFVEAAVLAALRTPRDERAFHAERDPLYALVEADLREAAFAALHARWFARLGPERPLRQGLDERPVIEARCARCVVVRAPVGRGEMADLLVSSAGAPHLLLRLRPQTLAAPEPALALLRRELLHAADMLDPGFGYEPRVPWEEATAHVRAARYRVLWDAYVDGRLVREGRAPSARRAERLSEFRRAFPALGDGAEAAFERFFAGDESTHAGLIAFAR